MKLAEILPSLTTLDREAAICMRRPWTLNAECEVVQLTESLGVPEVTRQAGFEYFLDVPVALEVLEGYADRDLSLEEQCERLLFYAENDAFPD